MGAKKKTAKKKTAVVKKTPVISQSAEKTMITLPEGSLVKIKACAESEGLSQSAWIRRLIFLGLEENYRRRGLL